MSSKKVLITGSNGLLGQHLAKYFLQSDKEVLATSSGQNRISALEHNYQSLDVTNPSQVKAVIADFQPDIIINAAAATNVDGCEDNPHNCDKINHQAVTHFINSFDQLEVTPHFIHISTDFIFNGTKNEYLEDDEPDPISEYGRSKWMGELALKNSLYKNYTIVRTSLVYGVGESLNKGNVFLWAMSKLRNDETLSIVDDQFRSPTYVNDLCLACVKISDLGIKGIINIAGDQILSMYEYVQKVSDYVGKSRTLVKAISTYTLNQKAKRPKNSGLNINKAKNKIGFEPTKFEQSLAEMDSL